MYKVVFFLFFFTSTNTGGASRTVYEVEESKNWAPSTNCMTTSLQDHQQVYSISLFLFLFLSLFCFYLSIFLHTLISHQS